MNRINHKLAEDKKLLSIYFTAGYPELEDTVPIIQKLEKSGEHSGVRTENGGRPALRRLPEARAAERVLKDTDGFLTVEENAGSTKETEPPKGTRASRTLARNRHRDRLLVDSKTSVGYRGPRWSSLPSGLFPSFVL